MKGPNRTRFRRRITRASLLAPLLIWLGAASCASRIDLLPEGSGGFCRISEGRLLITISNRGKRFSRATTTLLDFASHPPVHLPTRPVPPGGSVTISFPLPDVCVQEGCRFQIGADFKAEVKETDEANNTRSGACPKLPSGS